jgi:hypothetical protein
MAQTTRIDQGSAFWDLIDEKNFFRLNITFPKSNRTSRITFEQREIDEKFQKPTPPNWGISPNWRQEIEW